MNFYKNKETNELIITKEELNNNYIKLKENTEDDAIEKHLPIYKINNDDIEVIIGSIEHPMTEEHYIKYIIYIYNNNIEKVELKPNDKPKASFKYQKDSEIYAYCNLHGLWKTKVE